MSSLGRHGLGFVAASMLAGAASLALFHGPTQLGALMGLGFGAISGAISLGFVAKSAEKSLNAALMAVVGGFLGRILLVAVALLTAKAAGADLVAAASGFFVLYAVGQGLEISVVGARTRAQEHRA